MPQSSLAAPTRPGVSEGSIVYASSGLRIKAKVFWPPGPGPFPGIVYNHDGVSGLSRSTLQRCREWAWAGFAVIAPSFRGEDGSEGEVEVAAGEVDDALAALGWLRTQPRVDASRLGMVGTSHGALVSLLAAVRAPELRVLVFGYGVADIYSWYEHLKRTEQLGNDMLTRQVYGGGPQDKSDNFRRRHGLSVLGAIRTPVFIVQGTKDRLVPSEQAQELWRGLRKLGKPVELRLYTDSGHGFLIYRERELSRHGVLSAQYRQSRHAWADVLDFLRARLGRSVLTPPAAGALSRP